MSGDIEEFLRRAAQRRRQRPPDIEIIDADVVEDAEVIEESGILSGENVGSHVAQHLDTSSYDERLSHFGEDIGESDDRMDAHLQEVFEHRLGDLGSTTSETAESTTDLEDKHEAMTSRKEVEAAVSFDVAAMFRTPASLRNAIIISEIIDRPEHRW